MHLAKPFWVIIPLIATSFFAAACSSLASDNPKNDSTSLNGVVSPSLTSTPKPVMVAGTLGQQLDDYFTEDMPLFSGSVLVAHQGEVVLSKGYNYADWELRVPNTNLTKFRITSITKSFTATLIMMMYERGLIDLEAQICSYLPDCPDSWGEITIHQLLTHTSGIPEYTRLTGARENSRDPHNVIGLLALFQDEPLVSTPGEDFQYSNSNYIVLGAIIEQVSGASYADFLVGTILEPLEMEDTGPDLNSQILKGRASGYQIQGRLLMNAPYLDMTNAFATAGMYSTVEDLYKWDQALYTDLLLRQENLELMFSPSLDAEINSDYGYGWRIGDFQGKRKIWHAGTINGFRAYLARYPDDQSTIIILSNIETDDISSIVEDLEGRIFANN